MNDWEDQTKPPLEVDDDEARRIVELSRVRTGGATHLIEILLRARGPVAGTITRAEIEDNDFGWTYQSAKSTGLIEVSYFMETLGVGVLLTGKGRAQLRLHVEAVRRALVQIAKPVVMPPVTRTKRRIDID